MSQNIIAALLIGIAMIVGAYFLSQRPVVVSNSDRLNVIDVSAEGKSKATPDVVTLTIGAEDHAVTSSGAQELVNTSISRALAAIKGAGVPDAKVQTSQLSLYPDYTYGQDGKRVENGYRASQTLTVRIESDAKNVSQKIIDSVSQINNIRIDNTGYDMVDTTKATSEARADALKKARAKADEIAAAMGVKIVGVRSVSESAGYTGRPIYATMAMKAEDSGAMGGSNISLGDNDYTVTVNVSYEIK